jgi:hypothetical protein
MGKLIVVIAIVGAIAYAWHKGWIGEWIGAALDSGTNSVKKTQRDSTKVRDADPGAPPEEKK